MLFNNLVSQSGGGNVEHVSGQIKITTAGNQYITVPEKAVYICLQQYGNPGFYYSAYNKTGEKLEHMMHSGVYDSYQSSHRCIWCSGKSQIAIREPVIGSANGITWLYWYGYIPD